MPIRALVVKGHGERKKLIDIERLRSVEIEREKDKVLKEKDSER